MNPTKVITGVVRLSYANVWEPKSINGGAEKYSVSLIIPKSDTKTLSAINEAVNAAIEEGKGEVVSLGRTELGTSCEKSFWFKINIQLIHILQGRYQPPLFYACYTST